MITSDRSLALISQYLGELKDEGASFVIPISLRLKNVSLLSMSPLYFLKLPRCRRQTFGTLPMMHFTHPDNELIYQNDISKSGNYENFEIWVEY